IDKNSVTNRLYVTVPASGWAAKVLPDVPPEQREARMWDVIFDICRIRRDDPVAGWQAHVQALTARSDYLNSKRYTALHYIAPGTDLTVGLPRQHVWGTARQKSRTGIDYVSNIPTEEVFTLPHKDRIDGVVTATKPLSLVGGILIEDFCLEFKNGRAVNATA